MRSDCMSVDYGSSKGRLGPSQAPWGRAGRQVQCSIHPPPPLAVHSWDVYPLGAPRWLGQGAMQGLVVSQTGKQGWEAGVLVARRPQGFPVLSLGCGLLWVLQPPSGIRVGVSP